MRVQTLPPGSEEAQVQFRLRTLRTGVWPSIFSCVYLAVYYGLTPHRAHRAAEWCLLAVALVSTLAIARIPPERLLDRRVREPFFLGWSIGLITMIAAGAGLDGGPRSPIAVLLFLPLAYSALSYPMRSMLIVGAADVLAYSVLALVGGGVSGASALVVVGALGNATWICAWQARNHELQREELARMSRTDALTGVLNRRGFDERFAAELARAARDSAELTLAVIDLDGFKGVNDTRGHSAGDALLCRVAQVLFEGVRVVDTVGRLGGDEFALLLPSGGDEVLLRVRSALADVTPATFGVARYPLDGSAYAELHQAADADLYASKPGADREPATRTGELSWAAALADAVDRRMSVSHDHGTAVAEMAAGLARELGWPEHDLDDLRLAAMLHDVGKITVPEHILRKPGPLNEDEWQQMRKHAAAGGEIVASIDGLERIVPWVRHSHERVDGRGYPDGLAGEEIPEAARILLVADAFDAMISDRAYRRGMPAAEALAELERHAGSQFDARCVAALRRHLGGVGQPDSGQRA